MNLSRVTHLLFLISLILSGFWYLGGSITGLLLLSAAVIGCRSVFMRHTWQVYTLSKLMLIYLFWLFVIPNASMTTLAILAGFPIMYLVASNTPNFAELWKGLRIFLFIMGVGLAAWAIWQVIQHVDNGQAVGPLLDRNAFAALMNLLWFPAAYLLLASKSTSSRWKQLLLGSGLFVISTALFATASRGGIGTWLILFPILLWAGYRYTQSKRWIAIIPLIALLAYLCSAQLLHSSVAERTFQLAQDESANARLLLWKSTIQMIVAHPLSGTGWGTFSNYYPAYRSPLENSTAGFYAHNDYLQLAAEGGVPFLLILLGVMLGLLFQLRFTLKRVMDAAGLESIALLLGVLAIFIQAAVNFIFYYAFINILAGLFLAYSAQLIYTPGVVVISGFKSISRSIKLLLASFIVLLVAAPFVLRLISYVCLVGEQPGLQAINLVAPNVTAYNIARIISAISPQEPVAQEYILQTSEHALADSAGISMSGVNFQKELLSETLERFDAARLRNTNSPSIGVREVKILMQYHTDYESDAGAYAKAHQILNDNLKADPYHADSMITLARLERAVGHRTDALNILQRSKNHVLSRRDHQLIDVETLRQLAAPKLIAELDDIEKQLRLVRSEAETGKPLILPANFSEDIDERLKAIAARIG